MHKDTDQEKTRRTVLITGGAGFFGGLLKHALLAAGHDCVSVDIQPDDDSHPHLISITGDISDPQCLEAIFAAHRFDAVFHIAAMLAHEKIDKDWLWRSNVDATRLLAECAKKYHVPKVIYTSSNCLFSRDYHRPVTEAEPPEPIEIYGRSKFEGEKILLSYAQYFDAVIFRCPTIMGAQRLGLMTILFEFIDENRKLWVVGSGNNRYQYIYAPDLVNACLLAMDAQQSGVFNIGSDNVKTLREVYSYVIAQANSRSKICSLPGYPMIQIMKLCYWLGISPLGPYHYRMIAASFVFDTTRIKQAFGWRPTKVNEEMLLEAYQYYVSAKTMGFAGSKSAHRRPAAMGIIRLLKWLS